MCFQLKLNLFGLGLEGGSWFERLKIISFLYQLVLNRFYEFELLTFCGFFVALCVFSYQLFTCSLSAEKEQVKPASRGWGLIQNFWNLYSCFFNVKTC